MPMEDEVPMIVEEGVGIVEEIVVACRLPRIDKLMISIVSTKAGRQSTLGYTHGSSLSVDRCASYELDGDAIHGQCFYPGSAAVWA